MGRRLALLVAVLATFAGGSRLARGKGDGLVEELGRRQARLFQDLRKIEQAVKDIVEIREMRESGKYVLNAEERKLERKARLDFHIFMERFRNETLETLEIYDRVLGKQDYVDPLVRLFGDSLREIVKVAWDEEDIENVVAEVSEGYGVPIALSGDMDYRKTVSLNGEMSLLAILLYLENVLDAKLTPKDGRLWFMKADVPKERAKDGE